MEYRGIERRLHTDGLYGIYDYYLEDLYIYGYIDSSKGMKLVSVSKEIRNEIINLQNNGKNNFIIIKKINSKYDHKLTTTEIKYIQQNL